MLRKMSGKRTLVDLDPDYEDVSEQQTKRRKVMEDDAKEATKRKIETIIKKQFDVEIENKETELLDISEKLELARSVMDRLRACIVASFYGNANQQKSTKKASEQTPMIHPTVRKFIGKAPPGTENPGYKTETPTTSHTKPVVLESEKIGNLVAEVKTPGPFDPVPTDNPVVEKEMTGSRQGRFKVKKRIIVGNVSKSIPADQRDDNDQATHKWMVYVRGSKENPNIGGFVKKIWFFLHPSYRPNDLVEVSQPPFHLTRRGWGEFPVRVQIHFKDSRNKRVDIIHNLKLDRTYTGLQTLGAETVVDIEIERDKTEVKQEKKQRAEKRIASCTNNVEIKQEPIDCMGHSMESTQIRCQTFPLCRDIKIEPVDHDYGRSACVNGITNINSQHSVKKEPESQVEGQQSLGDISEQSRSVSSGVQTIGSTSVITTLAASVMTSLPQTHNHLTLISSSSPSKQQILSNSGNIILTSPPGNMVLKSIGPVGGATNNTVNLKLLDSGKSPPGTQAKVNLNFSQTGLQLNRPQTVNQAKLPVNQSNNSGLVFLKCTDSQGKTFLIPQQIQTTLTSPTKGMNSAGNIKQAVNNRPILLTSAVPGSNITNLALPGNTNLVQGKQIVQTLVRTPNTAMSPNRLQKSPLSNGPVFFIKPENVNRAPLTVKTSNVSSAASTQNKITSNIQIVRNCAPKQNSETVYVKPVNSPVTPQGTGTQSINKGQLKVTPQGLIHVQGQTSSPVVGVSPGTVERNVKNSIRPKQPVVLIPSNGKVTLLPGKGKSLLNSVINTQVQTQGGNNFIVLNQTVSPVGNGNVVCVTPSNVVSQNKTGNKVNKSDMFVLQSKQPKTVSGAPNHVVIIPVSSEQNSSLVTSTISSTNTPVTIATTQNKVLGNTFNSSSTSDKGNDKTVLIVVQNDNKIAPQNSSHNETLSSTPKSSTSLLSSLPSFNVKNTPKLLSESQQLRHVFTSSGDAPQKHVLLVNDTEEKGLSQSKYDVEDRKCIMDPKKKRQKNISIKEFIQPICLKDHPDLLSLIRTAVSRHPLVSEDTGRSLHPYCGSTHTDWLSWNIGKRRASEWQRASCVRKFIQQALGGSTSFKGELLWTTKQILVWCRLHAYSPHYLEKPLHPTGIDLQAETSLLSDKHRKKFSTMTGVNGIQEDLAGMEKTTPTTDAGEEEVDILFDSPVKVKTNILENSTDNPAVSQSECLPLTEGSLYVEEMANQIGVKLQQTEVDPGYIGTLVHGMLYKSMENFMSDILRETFALQVNMGRYPDTLSVADVYEALKSLSVTDFLTNKNLGVEENVGISTAPT